jgi:DNA topoisomerase-1
MVARVTIKGTKMHYTEARLVQLLEEKGIGRPSTFSSLLDKIQERGYVKKQDIKGKEMLCVDYELESNHISPIETKREFGNEKGKLVIQPLGVIVMEFLEKHFDSLFEYNYTCKMEDALDKVAKGDQVWHELCRMCNEQIDQLIHEMGPQAKMSIQIDDHHTYMVGKYGPVVKCVENDKITFKPLRSDVDVDMLEKGVTQIQDIVDVEKPVKNSSYVLGQHNGHDVLLKKGKYGLYITWDNCKKPLKEFGNRPMENITFEEIQKYLQEGSNVIREIRSDVSIRKGPKGDYLFYKSAKMKQPTFYNIQSFSSEMGEDYKKCDMNLLKSWISDKYDL